MRTATKRQLEIYEARKQHPSIRATARALGINYKGVHTALKLCELYGLPSIAEKSHPHTPIGNLPGKVTTQIDYRKDPAGQVVQEWIRSTPAEVSLEHLIEYLEHRIPSSKAELQPVTNYNPEIMLQIDLADVHYGLLAWGKETGDSDYDMDISRALVHDTMKAIFSRSGEVYETLFVIYGDNFHADFFNALTEKSRHSLDVDSRYPKMIFTGADAYISAIEIILQFSRHVRVIVLYGNHDKQTSVNLQLILHTHFRLADPERVTIDLEPSKTRYHVWGCTAQNFHHGDGTKPERLAADVMRYVSENDIIGVREYRANQAHLHREERRDINTVIYECKASPVARDSFASGALFLARQATVSTIFHKRYGELDRYTITPRMLRVKKEELLSGQCG